MLRAEALRQALAVIKTSMMPSLTWPGATDWTMNTSSSRTDSPMETLVSWFEYFRHMVFATVMPSLQGLVSPIRTLVLTQRGVYASSSSS